MPTIIPRTNRAGLVSAGHDNEASQPTNATSTASAGTAYSAGANAPMRNNASTPTGTAKRGMACSRASSAALRDPFEAGVLTRSSCHVAARRQTMTSLLSMIVVTRYRVVASEAPSFATRAHAALDALSSQRGYRTGGVGHNVDDDELWTLTTLWDDTGSYRRALSSTDVKLAAVPLLSEAIAEPTAYEQV